ncbi:MAG: hypothetical protein KDC79_01820 [Cyclobacteriaceae bacterium]|nr:hypothetical protein [Cyclobacteriaceae bacterium]
MTKLISLLTLFSISFIHPFHVTVCEIEHDAETKALQVSERMFLDDLEETLDKTYHVRLDIMHPEDKNLRDSLIQDYVLKHLSITVDGKPRKRTYIGHEIEDDVMWCYVEYYGVKKLDNLEITNTVFFDIYEDQSTIVHVSYDGNTKSKRLTRLKPTETFSFLAN